MYTKEYLETYNGKFVGIELWSDQGCVIYGMLWTNQNGFLISDMNEVICDSYDLSISEFNKRTYVNSMKYADIKTFESNYQRVSKELLTEIEKASLYLKTNMRNLGFTGPAEPIIDKSKYPHHCTQCSSAAYIGAMNNIECSNPSCKHYQP